MKLGHLHVNHLHQTHLQSSTLFQPHISRVSAISISSDNSLFATSSIKGTIIRVYNSITLQLTHQLRRGSDIAHITSSSLSFSPDNRHLALISDKSTLHLWNLSNGSRSRSTSLFHLPSLNLHSSLSPFVSSSQQYAHYNNFQESFVLAWESINTIIITSTFGRLFKFSVSYEEGDKSSLQPLDFNNFVSLLRS
ncbi:SVP1-like protein 2 [Wallemia ichthyophaga EXF-994]|uniref:SVP1-like protein 2 n=1 Tax=Wallemia ichthyophaga (strain EXF-994 / CBS 113033) TaxID=1299270 RepID=R9ABT8_WALI9|nr:SVP1-like protein 2 [Wallemia ichthyophaga EXF-994]EOQ99626.1 SVP1-like protein 2 [Wallemia ichthyophaga EXF-994]